MQEELILLHKNDKMQGIMKYEIWSSCLHRASIVPKHFLLFQLMHTIIKSPNVKTTSKL